MSQTFVSFALSKSHQPWTTDSLNDCIETSRQPIITVKNSRTIVYMATSPKTIQISVRTLFVFLVSTAFITTTIPSLKLRPMTNHSPTSPQSQLNGNISTSKYPCCTCDRSVSWRDLGVACEGCGLWYHLACQNIPSNQYDQLDDSDVIWNCTVCEI